MSIPTTRSSVVQTARGAPDEVMKFVHADPMPILESDEVLIKVSHVSINQLASKIATVIPTFIRKVPGVTEHEFAGVVVDSNGHEDVWGVGTEVFGCIPVPEYVRKGRGALSTYIAAPISSLFPRPPALSPELAASLPIISLAAHLALHKTGNIKPGDRVFINGGTSSVGIMAVQLAKLAGAVVGTSVGAEEGERIVRELGADEVFNYKASPVHEQLSAPSAKPYDLFFDTIGLTPLYLHSPAYLKPSGTFISINAYNNGTNTFWGNVRPFLYRQLVAVVWPTWLGGTNRKFKEVLAEWDEGVVEEVGGLVGKGAVTVRVDSRWKFGEEGVRGAYQRCNSGRAKGRIIIEMP